MENRVNRVNVAKSNKMSDYDLIDNIINIANKENVWEYKFDEEDYFEANIHFNDNSYRIIESIEDEIFLNENEIKKIEYILFKKDLSDLHMAFYRVISKEVVYTDLCEKKIIYKK